MSLCKYYTPESFDFVFKPDGISIRFTQPMLLNDVFDSNIAVFPYDESDHEASLGILARIYKNDKEALERVLKTAKNKLSDTKRNQKQLNDSINKKFGVFSTSMNLRSKLMWAYYSKDHTGFMIAFNQSNLGLDEILFRNEKVQYNTQRKKFTYTDYSSLTEPLFFKDKEWEHEEEVRLVSSLKTMEAEATDTNGYPLYLSTVHPEHIKYIMLGYRCSSELKQKIHFWVDKYGHSKIKIFETELSLTKFKLHYKTSKI